MLPNFVCAGGQNEGGKHFQKGLVSFFRVSYPPPLVQLQKDCLICCCKHSVEDAFLPSYSSFFSRHQISFFIRAYKSRLTPNKKIPLAFSKNLLLSGRKSPSDKLFYYLKKTIYCRQSFFVSSDFKNRTRNPTRSFEFFFSFERERERGEALDATDRNLAGYYFLSYRRGNLYSSMRFQSL